MERLINREDSQKLYVQLYEILRGKIENVDWAVDSQIPTEEDLCKTYEVSKATVRLAVSELARQGYLRCQQGRGTFVCKRIIPEGISMLTSFKENMIDAGVTFSTRVLAQTIVMPIDDLDIKLNIPEDKHVIYIKRLRSVDEEPVLLQETYMPHDICPLPLEEDLESNSLFDVLEKKCGVKITSVQDYIGIAYLNEEEGRLLGLSEGSAALLLEQLFYSGKKRVMYTRSVKRPDRFKLFVELERKT
ncbi:MAG: GntR family transcriptional regulator [Thermodesulfovibrionales bacterium]|nr:GntR family transcriptional regulator [Thermodesulfovibrionales bacterium]